MIKYSKDNEGFSSYEYDEIIEGSTRVIGNKLYYASSVFESKSKFWCKKYYLIYWRLYDDI